MEIMVAVLVLTILATLSIPAFIKTAEVSKGRLAKSYLKLIYSAEKGYYNENNCFYPQTPGRIEDLAKINKDLGIYLEPSHFDYSITTSSCNEFRAEARRKSGRYIGWIIWIDQNGEIKEENKP